MEVREIAEKLEVTERTIMNWQKNKIIRTIIDYFKMEQIKEVRQKVIAKTANITSWALEELQDEIKQLSGREKIAAIKVLLEYDSKNKINENYTNDAMSINTGLF